MKKFDYGIDKPINFQSPWSYRKSHIINSAIGAGSDYQVQIKILYDWKPFYNLSSGWVGISGDPTNRHYMFPTHKTNIVEVNKVVDGSTRKYLAYDCNTAGDEIRLYYTDDLGGAWTAYSGNPIIGPSAGHTRRPSVAYDNGTFYMFVADKTDKKIERWTSINGISFEYQEDMDIGANLDTIYMSPFIWFNPNDNNWYLYRLYHHTTPANKKLYVRKSVTISGLKTASESIVMTGGKTPVPTVMYRNGKYWLLTECQDDCGVFPEMWRIYAFYSDSPDSGFTECSNSPIANGDVGSACEGIGLSPDGSKAYLFYNIDNSGNWNQRVREIYSTFPSGYENNVGLNGHCKTDFSDIRFKDNDGVTELDYWLESKVNGDHAIFWVKINDDLSLQNQTIYVYYGNGVATYTNPRQHGIDTFNFFDGEGWGGSIDWAAKWASINHANYSISEECLKCIRGAATTEFIRSQNTFGEQECVTFKVKFSSVSYTFYGMYGDDPVVYSWSNAGLGYMAADSTPGGRFRYRNNIDADITTDAFSITPIDFQIINLKVDNADIDTKCLQDSLEKGSQEANDAKTGFSRYIKFLFWETGAYNCLIEHVYIRKHVDPEPIHGAWGYEEFLRGE